MRKKTKEIEDKALTPDPSPNGEGSLTGEEGRTIKMRPGRAWNLGERTLKSGEMATLDAATAADIVAAGYADYVS